MQNLDNLCLGCMGAKLETDVVCPACTYDSRKGSPEPALAPRTILRERYIIGKILKTNGEGVTYLGFDTKLHAPVRIREYLPESKISRDDDGETVICEAEFEENYAIGLSQFIELARKLARVGSMGAILKVYDVFEENNTCYYISEHIETIAFREFLLRNGGTLKWSQLQPLLNPVITTLASLHEFGIIHRGISPETITISRDGKMRIVDFSIESIRFARSDFKPQLYPGYAAIEQYGFEEKANESTDIYAVAAVIYRTLVGNPPPEATIRVADDDSMAIPAAVVEATPTHILESLVSALQILPEDRIQSTKEFRASLFDNQNTMHIDLPANNQPEKEDVKKSNSVKTTLITTAIMVVIIAIIGFVLWSVFFADDDLEDPYEPTVGVIRGSLIDDDGYAIVDATLVLHPGSIETATNHNGAFEFADVPTGSHNLYKINDDGDEIAFGDAVVVTAGGAVNLELVYNGENISIAQPPAPESILTGPTVTVPSVIGRTLQSVLDDSGLSTNFAIEIAVVLEYSDDIPAGSIVRQSRAQGEVIPLQSPLVLTVSLGPAQFTIPNVAGLTRADAMLRLWQSGFLFSDNAIWQDVYDANATPQRVINTNPPIGTTITRTTPIEILFNSRAEPEPEPEPASAWPAHPTHPLD